MTFSRLTMAISLTLFASSAFAGPQSFSNARSFAMGGTGVAIAQPGSAPASNPAMMAAKQHEWVDDFALVLPSINARFADGEETIDQIDDIQDTVDEFEQAQATNDVNRAQNAAGTLREQLNRFDRDTVRIDAGVGMSLAIPLEQVSVGVFTDVSLRATVRGELDDQDDALLQRIENGSPEIATADLENDLQSRGRVLAAAVGEVGVSFARSFELPNGQPIELGVSPKYMELRTFQYADSVGGFEDDNADSGDSETEDSGLNLDLGAAYAFGPERRWRAGVMIENVIPMDLDSAQSRPLEEKRSLEIDPRITTGIAHTGEFHVVTAELDLTENKAFGFEDDTQWLALGAEFDALRLAQLRVGLRQNLADNSNSNGVEESTQATFGIGVSPFGAQLELSGLVSDADKGVALELGAAF